MKTVLKLTLAVAAFVLCGTTTSFGQKFGYINSQELIAAMPELDSVRIKMDAYQKDLTDMLESIQVEYNNKQKEYQDGYASMSEPTRKVKERELVDLQNRFVEFQESAQNDVQRMQAQLMQPVFERAQNAIKKVSKAGGYLAVFDLSTGALAYYDESSMTDILAAVKAELGIQDKPATTSTTTPAAAPAN